MALDLIIKNGTVVTASDSILCDIGIQNGRIVQLGGELNEAAEIIDATGLYVMPGGIDSHVHISQPSGDGIVMADDFESGTRSALFGGNTLIMPFCLQESGQTLRQAIDAYRNKAHGNCYTDISFHLIISDPSPQVLGQELPAAVEDGYTSFKIFMTYEALRLNDAEILATMDTARRTGALVMVHCENEDAIQYLIGKHEEEGRLQPASHASTRPIAAEREATHRAVSLAEIVDVPVVIVHISNGDSIEEVKRARDRGRKVVAETCPQYLMLTASDLDGMDWEGAKFVCSPPPRTEREQAQCWLGLETGAFDLFSSDHCPFRYEDEQGKLNPKGKTHFKHVPNGIPGVELRGPILFSEGLMKGRIDASQFVALTSTNHAKTYGIYPQKGTIAVGSDADITLWDPALTKTVRHAELHDAADYSPYEGKTLTGWPVAVVLGGRVMMRDGELLGSKGDGQYRSRNRSPLAAVNGA